MGFSAAGREPRLKICPARQRRGTRRGGARCLQDEPGEQQNCWAIPAYYA